MSRFRLLFSVILVTLLSFCAYANAQAQEENTTIVTPVPAPKEEVVVPQGYSSCFNVEAGWYKGVWYPQHRVCQYDPDKVQAAQGDAWVASYWACTKYSTGGQCTNWDWKPGHWVKALPVY